MRSNQLARFTAVFAASALSFLLAVSCGKNKDDDNSSGGGKTTITDAQVTGSQAVVSYESDNGSDDFQCRIIENDKVGEWYPCPGGKTTVTVYENQQITFEVRNGSNGEITKKRLEALPEATPSPSDVQPTDPSNPNNNTAQAFPLYDARSGMIPLAGNRYFRVPQGQRAIRFSTNATFRGNVNVYNLIPDSRILQEFTNFSPCESGQVTSANMRVERIFAVSSPEASAAEYCRYQAPAEAFKATENFDMALNHIESATEPGQPFELISVSEFTGPADATYTRRLFTENCGVPGDYLGSRIPAGNGFRSTWQAYNGAGRPSGFIRGGTFYNLPVQYDYVPGRVLDANSVHWCLTDRTVETDQGLQRKRFFIGTFEAKRRGANTSDLLEYHVVSEALGQEDFEFAITLVNRALSTLVFSLPSSL